MSAHRALDQTHCVLFIAPEEVTGSNPVCPIFTKTTFELTTSLHRHDSAPKSGRPAVDSPIDARRTGPAAARRRARVAVCALRKMSGPRRCAPLRRLDPVFLG